MFFNSGAILSDRQIVAAVRRQHHYLAMCRRAAEVEFSPAEHLAAWWLGRGPRIHIDDFDPTPSSQGGPCNPGSYNLRLHPELVVYDIPVITNDRPVQNVDWEPYTLDMRKYNPTKKIIIPENGYLLKPSRVYLGKSVEYTETYNLVPVLDGRSSIGRLGMTAHVTAGYGDNFWKGHWTLEIVVVQPVKIYPNVRIAQVRYHTTGKGSTYAGKYLNTKGSSAEPSRIWQELCTAVEPRDRPDR